MAQNVSLAYGDLTIDNTTVAELCASIKDLYPDRTDAFHVQFILGFLYIVVCLCGVCGNILVIYVALCEKISFTVRTVFIVNLACSDLTTGLTSLPITAISTIFTREWVFGWLVCYFIGFLQGCSIFASSFTLISIAVDRYFLIVQPHINRVTYRRACIAVSIFWMTAAVLSSPMIVFMKVVTYPQVCGEFCEEQWPSQTDRRIYGILVPLVQFGVPVICTSACYIMISNRLGAQIKTRQSQQRMLPESERRLIQRRRRTNRMMAAMVAGFVLMWLPWNFANLARDLKFDAYFLKSDDFNLTFAICHLVAMTSTACNPVIYSFFNESFRSAIKRMILGRRGWSDSSRSGGTTLKSRVHL